MPPFPPPDLDFYDVAECWRLLDSHQVTRNLYREALFDNDPCLKAWDDEFERLRRDHARHHRDRVTLSSRGKWSFVVKTIGLPVAGSDNVRDGWSPFGNGDMLERAMLIAYRAGLRTDEGLGFALELASAAGAEALDCGPHGLAVGCRGDFVAVEAETVAEAVAMRPPRSLVVKGGRVIAREGALMSPIPPSA